jgi:glycerophosphoryl diester phosphodiesterase
MRLRVLSGALAALVLALAAAPAGAAPLVVAHRGGPYVDGVPTFPENTLPAFAQASDQGDVVEFDVKLTADGVPVVMHDATLERTTTCTGQVAQKTLAQLERCRASVLGVPEAGLPVRLVRDPSVPIPTLRDVLALAKRTGATIAPEIKNYATDPDYDPSPAFAQTVMRALAGSGLPPQRIVVQSFTLENLDVAKAELPSARTSLLALPSGADAAIGLAAERGFDWVSPQWPVDPSYVTAAHAAGRLVVPFTIDFADQIAAAGAAGVDAVITNDPTLARRTLGLPPGDERAPRVALASRTVTVKGGVATAKVRCREDRASTCAGTLVLSDARRRILGGAEFAIPGGESQRVEARLKTGAKHALQAAGSVAGRATLSTADVLGNRRTTRTSVTLVG